MSNTLLCTMRTHVLGASFQEGKKNLLFEFLIQILICLSVGTCCMYCKEMLAFIFQHMVQDILGNTFNS